MLRSQLFYASGPTPSSSCADGCRVEQPYVLDRDHRLIGERGETLESLEASLRTLERQRQRLLDRLKSESR